MKKLTREEQIDEFIEFVYCTFMEWSEDSRRRNIEHISAYINDYSEYQELNLTNEEFEEVERTLLDMLSDDE